MIAHTSDAAKVTGGRREQPDLKQRDRARVRDHGEFDHLLGFRTTASVREIIRCNLLEPVRSVIDSRGKRVRGRLVALSYHLLAGDDAVAHEAIERCRICAEVVELIHAGSLVVDDIEDGSPTRRGKPALHVRYGLALALNAGNWLYFWPFELIRTLELGNQITLSIYEYYHRTLLQAHFGQGVDLGTRLERLLQSRVADVCLASMELKTGALMGFAAGLGAMMASAAEPVVSTLDRFGRRLGVALQMFDDLGNVLGIRDPLKKYEDFKLRRPSWAWACAAKTSSPTSYRDFISAVGKLPKTRELELWLEKHRLIETMREGARFRLQAAFDRLEERLEVQRVRWSRARLAELRALGETIAGAYE
ncbi:MAG TPA: polyprenyl synthetase family protein [Candidatus Eisenbacteria bacterium]|nr:polyprenyl synthetase family protein [Candidatus Eisenbacteria bacterium]